MVTVTVSEYLRNNVSMFVCLFVLFRLYVPFNKNLSVISQLCLDVAGSSMLTFRVLPD